MASSAPLRTIAFGEFEAKLDSRELYRNGVRVRLPDQSFHILAILIDRSGELVTREEIRQRLWPGDTFVDFDHGLNNAVNRLREALGDSADSPHFIETLPRRGYRFIAPVSVGADHVRFDGDASAQSAAASPATTPEAPPGIPKSLSRRSSRSRKSFIPALVLVGLVALAAGAYWTRLRTRLPRIESLAVLPLENVSGQSEQDFFADGMTDSLITKLAGLRSVRVISRTSAMHYKGSRKALPEIARELRVDAVVEGTIMRQGERVRINAQLIDARTDRHLWAKAYDSDVRDVLALQAELADAIAAQVAHSVEQPSRPTPSKPVSPEAYDAYIRGRQEWAHGAFTDEGYEKSRAYFNRALQLDPDYTDAIIGLAETYISTDPAAARALAARALQVNANVGAAHTIAAVEKAANEWDFVGADSEFKQGLELEPNSVLAHSWYGVFLAQTGQSERAIRELKIAESLDPFSPSIQADMGLTLYLARRYDEAERVLRRVLSQDPRMTIAHRHLVRVYAARERIPEYLDEILKSNANGWYQGPPDRVETLVQELRAVYASQGAQAFWRTYAERELRGPRSMHPLGLARLYAHLGDRDRCIAVLESLYRDRDLMLAVWAKSDPEFDNVRSDPRFQTLLRKIGYPQSVSPEASLGKGRDAWARSGSSEKMGLFLRQP